MDHEVVREVNFARKFRKTGNLKSKCCNYEVIVSSYPMETKAAIYQGTCGKCKKNLAIGEIKKGY